MLVQHAVFAAAEHCHATEQAQFPLTWLVRLETLRDKIEMIVFFGLGAVATRALVIIHRASARCCG